ncbi:MAG: hypothetical protein H6632_01645 [Anaerolineales bacterium]|nr:hypothetical protein [Anaerolineales bacterium]
MSELENSSNDFVIKIPASMLGQQKTAGGVDQPKATNDYHFFARTNITPIRVKRNSEHGLTEVQSLAFTEQGQREKVLSLLHTPALYDILPYLYDYVFRLGCAPEAERRYYAAIAVGHLATKLPFIDLKQHIILPWAKTNHLSIQLAASLALSDMLEHDLHKSDVLMLIRHWVSNPSPALKNTALLTYYWLAQSYPKETLDAIKVILSRRKISDYPKVIDLYAITYDLDPGQAIEHLHSWLMQTKNVLLCWMAGLLFFSVVRLDDVTESDESRTQAVEMTFTLWDDPKIPVHLEMQEQTNLKVERWAREALTAWDAENPEPFIEYRTFFKELHQKYQGHRRNRLENLLQRCQSRYERKLARNSRRGRDVSNDKKQQVGFLDLIV